MLLQVGHNVDEADVYIAIKIQGYTANILISLIVQLIFNIMAQEKVFTPSETFRPSYPVPVIQALHTYFNRFRYPVQLYAEDMHLTLLETMFLIEQ